VGAPDWIDRLEAKGTRVDRAIITPRPSELVQVEPSAPAMTAEEAARRLRAMEVRSRRKADAAIDPFEEDRLEADAAALALAIRALELVPKLAACEALPFGGGRRAVLLTGTTWDALRALAAEGGR
jgi:hypothetical protein